MDAAILTTFFCFILLVINLLMFTQMRDLTKQLHHYVDRSDLHSEKLKTILSVLQQLEAKQDLMFNNAPPVPGETSELPREAQWLPNCNKEGNLYWVNPPGAPKPNLDNRDILEGGNMGWMGWNSKVSTTVPTHKPEDVLKASKKAKADFEARQPYHVSNIANGVIELPGPKKRGPKPGSTKGIKRGPYKTKARLRTI